jgi:uncharacterized protein GlcG (DUF336 family)
MNKRGTYRPELEPLENRTVPALIASQYHPTSLPQPEISKTDVFNLLCRAAAATTSDDAIVAVVDRGGHILGVRVEGNVSPMVTGNQQTLDFSIDGAVALARTGAFFSSNAQALTSRSIRFISQSTITQRMVDSSFYVANTMSGTYGPGFVAPVGDGSNFPPGVDFTPLVDLFGIEYTNRVKGATNAYTTASYAATIGLPGAPPASRGIATLPGGIPLYKNHVLVGGIGVFFPGTTGYATEENSSLSTTFDPSKPDRSLEAETVAFVAAGGSSQAGFTFGPIGGCPAVPFDLPFNLVDLAGITIDAVGQGGGQGPTNLINYARSHFAIGLGNANSGVNEPVDAAKQMFLAGKSVPYGWLVAPHNGVGITAAQVENIVAQGLNTANITRAQIRPLGSTVSMVFAVSDLNGNIVGLYRMPDATVFSTDVATAKARNVAYYDNPAEVSAVDLKPTGLPPGVSFTNRTFRFLVQAYYPEGQEGSPPGPFSALNDPGINPVTAQQIGPALPASDYTSIGGFEAFHPAANFHAKTPGNGVVFFPGSSGLYVGGSIIGGVGVSGDGVNQDDFVTAGTAQAFQPPNYLRADQFFVLGLRLPYLKFPRNPTGI